MEIKSNCHNDFYLKTKRDKLGHKLFKLNDDDFYILELNHPVMIHQLQ